MAENTERVPFYRRGPYPAEEEDLTHRQSGWLMGSLVVAVLLTIVSAFVFVTWPVALIAWVVVAALFVVDVAGKKVARRHAESAPAGPPPPEPRRREPDPAKGETP